MTISEFQQRLSAAKSDPRTIAYDTAPFGEMSADDRRAAEDLLVAWASAGDVRAVAALSAVPVDRSLPVLESVRRSGDRWTRAAAVSMLARLRGDVTDLALLRAELAQQREVERALSVYDLKQSSHRSVIPPLLDAMMDPSPVVRVHAQEVLVAKLALTPFDEPRQAPLRRMQLAGMNRLESAWPRGQAELRTVFEAILSGVTPVELDLPYRGSADPTLAESFWSAICEWGGPLPLERVPELGEHDRAWFKTVMISRLTGRDPRSPRVLQLLGTQWLSAHLSAALSLADEGDEEFIAECHRVLSALPFPQ